MATTTELRPPPDYLRPGLVEQRPEGVARPPCDDGARLPDHGIGLTTLVERPSRGIADLSREELEAGAARLREKLRRYRPRVVCFNGKAIYEVFAGRRCALGLQPERARSEERR